MHPVHHHQDVDTINAIVDTIFSPAVASLLSIHPNDVTLQEREPPQWSSWWTWALNCAPDDPEQPPAWLQLIHYFSGDDKPDTDIPIQLRSLLDSVRALQLERTPPAYESRSLGQRSHGLSPKKEHEVDRMSSYICHIVHSDNPRSVWHVADVGSGQGYLSRALQEMGFHVLALDNNENQTLGANRWTTREAARKLKIGRCTCPENVGKPTKNSLSHSRVESSEKENAGQIQCSSSPGLSGAQKGTLTHRTVHVCPQTLRVSIADWLANPPGIHNDDPHIQHSPAHLELVPVMLVALHACGSLSVDVLRTFLSDRAGTPQAKGTWRPHSLVVVGCCYNLMSPLDFPLSKPLRDMDPIPKLTIGALHLAAQVPSQWLRSQNTLQAAELALRKVVYRALLQPVLQAAAAQSGANRDHVMFSKRPIQPGLGETVENRRLGKLNDRAYQDWPTFLNCATYKLGIDLAAISVSLPEWFMHEVARLKMESALFALQTLRCTLGPLIETLILLDRRNWIQQELAEMNESGLEVVVQLVNLFDQATGSGRNVGLVIKPATNPH